MNQVGIIGSQGFVGRALSQVFMERGCEVIGYDIKAPETTTINDKLLPGNKSPYLTFTHMNGPVFICVPTPMKPDGSCDTNLVEVAVGMLVSEGCRNDIVIKSTVPPGTTAMIQERHPQMSLVFNPEFLSEATAIDDFRNQTRIILGGEKTDAVKAFYETNFPQIPVYVTNSTSAEMVKYISNCFFAVNISFANEIKQVCDAVGIDYTDTIKVSLSDPRLDTEHWKVPGPSPASDGSGRLPGFGGTCFPKDLQAMITLCKSLGVAPTVMEAAWDKNIEVRPGKDWERLVGRCVG